jgi:hypothetical protein
MAAQSCRCARYFYGRSGAPALIEFQGDSRAICHSPPSAARV